MCINVSYNLEDVNDQFNDFLARLEGCVDRHAPIKELNQREKKLINKPWITKEIIKLIKKHNCIFKNKKKKADVNTIRAYNYSEIGLTGKLRT